MSEAITKACEACAGIGRPMTFWNGVVDCVDCSGTGRVPDEVATLRAKVDCLTKELADTKRHEQAEYDGRAAAIADIDVVRLTLASVFGRGHEERDVVELAADVVRVVAELRGSVDELTAARDHWKRLAEGHPDAVPVCSQCGGDPT